MIKNLNWQKATSLLFTRMDVDLETERPTTIFSNWPERDSNRLWPLDCGSHDALTTRPRRLVLTLPTPCRPSHLLWAFMVTYLLSL